jgi:8-oxo-dGTP pyrophosphatase MutT (NUDIX family)
VSRPEPPQVIPRPAGWRLGDPAPWADLAAADRQGISISRVVDALRTHGQDGAVPTDIGSDRVLGPSILINESNAPAVRFVNSAVLAALFDEANEAHLIFTRRSSSLRSHRGEVSFPGGRLDEGEHPEAAALREAHEEVALDPDTVTPVGWIHPVLTLVSGSLIMPVIATLSGRPKLVGSPDEVERVFEAPLRDLADPEIFHEERWQIPGRVIPGSPDNSFAVWFFEIEGEMIWGATARMIHELLCLVLLGRTI